MNFTDPSLYTVTPREMNVPFGGYPFAWQNAPQYLPTFQGYGMQPFPYTLPYQYGMQPFYGQFKPPYMGYGTQPFAQLGYPHPFQFQPTIPQNLPFVPPMQGWQRPYWY